MAVMEECVGTSVRFKAPFSMRTAENSTYTNISSAPTICITLCTYVHSPEHKNSITVQTQYCHLSSHPDVMLQLPQYFKNSWGVLHQRKLSPRNREIFLPFTSVQGHKSIIVWSMGIQRFSIPKQMLG